MSKGFHYEFINAGTTPSVCCHGWMERVYMIIFHEISMYYLLQADGIRSISHAAQTSLADEMLVYNDGSIKAYKRYWRDEIKAEYGKADNWFLHWLVRKVWRIGLYIKYYLTVIYVTVRLCVLLIQDLSTRPFRKR